MSGTRRLLLTDAGYQVSVIALRKKGQPGRETLDGVRVYRVPRLELFKKTRMQDLVESGLAFIKLKSSLGYLVEYCYFTAACLIVSSLCFCDVAAST